MRGNAAIGRTELVECLLDWLATLEAGEVGRHADALGRYQRADDSRSC